MAHHINIVVAEDHTIVRQGICALLSHEPNMAVVGEARTGVEALQLVDKLDPDILIVDLMLHGSSGMEVIRQVAQLRQRTRVVVLSSQKDMAYVVESISYGAAGYVLKDSSIEDLAHAIREVSAGRTFLSSEISGDNAFARLASRDSVSSDPLDLLTGREKEVLQLAAQGHTNAEIGNRLEISPRTVEIHRANAMRKMGLQNGYDLVRFAMRRGLIPHGIEDL